MYFIHQNPNVGRINDKLVSTIPSPVNWIESIPDPFAGQSVKKSKYWGNKSPQGKLYAAKQVRSMENFIDITYVHLMSLKMIIDVIENMSYFLTVKLTIFIIT